MSCCLFLECGDTDHPLQWPAVSREMKPWTRWWWMGSAVNEKDLRAAMESYRDAGLGGLEITPIYGVRGYEDQFIDFLSPRWVEMLRFTLSEAERLGLGIDMATGTGWPFGGPMVSAQDACKYVALKTWSMKSGQTPGFTVEYIQEPVVRAVERWVDISELVEPVSANKDLQSLALDQVRFVKPLPLLALVAYSEKGEVLNLTAKVSTDGKLDWTAPPGNWTLYALFQGWHGKMVERAAPGGEGDVIDYFSRTSLENYLGKFDEAFGANAPGDIRAFFNDSYEVDDARGQANWTPGLLDEFRSRRGYDLLDHLPALFGKDTPEKNIRVLCDYRQTMSELLLDNFTVPWQEWAGNRDAIIRNQAHGSPANILDLYGSSDIPETEGSDLPGIKLASSAAHVTGKKLTSSESATWLNEHFKSSLADVKQALDLFFLGGVNHAFYHGTTYSPREEPWPGWMFYASVHFGPTNTFWNHFPALNTYVTRCQSFLQSGMPDNDVLFYYPFHDLISEPGRELLLHFSSRIQSPAVQGFHAGAQALQDSGYSFDYISDRQLGKVLYSEDKLLTGGASYQAIVLPGCHYIPPETFDNLVHLASQGAVVVIHHDLPGDVPGFGSREQRLGELKEMIAHLDFRVIENTTLQRADTGKGMFLLGSDLDGLLTYAGIQAEAMVNQGLQYIRRKFEHGYYYFIVNRSDEPIDRWISICRPAKSVAIFNPLNGKTGMAAVRTSGPDVQEVYLQLHPGESCILQTFDTLVDGKIYDYCKPPGQGYLIEGSWKVRFISGGPILPPDITTEKLGSWTDFNEEGVKEFSGTARYTITFDRPEEDTGNWILDLGSICESARVRLNGTDLGVLFTPPYRVLLSDSQIRNKNRLEVEVSSLMANRIADMDRKGINYKKFYNINFPARIRDNSDEKGLFNASGWAPVPSGLIGPVMLIPVEPLQAGGNVSPGEP